MTHPEALKDPRFLCEYCAKCGKRCDADDMARRVERGQIRKVDDGHRCTAYVCAVLDEWR